MSFYETYLKGVKWGTIQVVIWPIVTGTYAFLIDKHVPVAVAVIASVMVGLVLVFVALIQPKAAEQLAADPKVIAAGAKAVVAPIMTEAQSQVEDATTDAVDTLKTGITDAADTAADTVSTALDAVDIAALKKLASVFRGQA